MVLGVVKADRHAGTQQGGNYVGLLGHEILARQQEYAIYIFSHVELPRLRAAYPPALSLK
jgi:hypothetical protein